jgi:signal transduction histidine kinase
MNAVSTGKDFLFEHRFRKHDGEYRWQLSRAVPQRDEHGKIQMWVGTSTDIDEMKKHEQLKDDFIKIASHELKTPVTTIRGYVQLLMQMNKNGNDQMLISSLVTIDKHVSKLTKLISDLLDVTKIETGIFHLSKENFNINELISELSGDIQSTNSSHKIIFTPGIETSLFADKDRISQVLINLIVNAIKYSPKADKVIISTQLQNDDIIVSVQDFGIGIDTDDHKKVFERFYRVQGKNEKTFPGFGIGLFIAKEIISNHNGKIWVESEKGKGSVFYFSLPVNTK